MANELFPQTPEAQPQAVQTTQPEQPAPPKAPSPLKQIPRKKALLLGLAFMAIVSMGTFIFIAPSQDIRSVASIPLPFYTPTPTIAPPTPTEEPTPTPTVTPIPAPTATPTPTIPPGTLWKTYSNTKYGYSIKYSPDWTFKDLGELEPKIPSYINFLPKTASDSSRFVTIASTTRTYDEQLALGASSSAITVSGIKGTQQSFQDSDGNTSTVVILPRQNDLIVIRAKTAYLTYFNLMLSTMFVAK